MSIVEILKEVIADRHQPAEERDRASIALKFYVAKEQEPMPTGEINQVVAGMLARVNTSALWKHPDDFVIETVTEKDDGGATQATRQNVVRKKETPAPLPTPAFEPAIPLPILPPSDVEQAAVKESALTFDERFSDTAVSARVAAIVAEAAAMRAAREQTALETTE